MKENLLHDENVNHSESGKIWSSQMKNGDLTAKSQPTNAVQ